MLRSLVLPHYAVQTIPPHSLAAHPWTANCALLVFPSCRGFNAHSSVPVVRSYVEHGGAFLSFGAGARCSSSRSLDERFGELSIGTDPEPQALRFYDKASGNYVYPVFPSTESPSTELAAIKTADGDRLVAIRTDNQLKFHDIQDAKNVHVLAHYTGEDGFDDVAAIQCEVSAGKLVLWASSLEYPCTKSEYFTSASERQQADQKRLDILRTTLCSLGLQLPGTTNLTTSRPLPQFLVSNTAKVGIVPRILESLSLPSILHEAATFKDLDDSFSFHPLAECTSVFQEVRNADLESHEDPPSIQPRHIIVCGQGELPVPDLTTHFNVSQFFRDLEDARKGRDSDGSGNPWSIGDALLYSEVVTSTQTLLVKNPNLLSSLAAPIVSLASQQLAGRGRGSNPWLSPTGCLQFSVLLRMPLSTIPTAKLVFVQYLFSLAVAEACRTEGVLGRLGEDVRLKWPNDLYAVIGPGEHDRHKIGGVLVYTHFSVGKVTIVIGCGVNVLTPPPVMSLSQLIPAGSERKLSMERTAAAILTQFEQMWSTFISNGGFFDLYLDLYLERWLHSDQLVKLTTTVPPTTVRIVGITTDYGLLRTVPERTGWASGDEGFIDLQPDGNSFDLMAGLIKSKNN